MIFDFLFRKPFDERLKQLNDELVQLYPFISKWPPNIKSLEERNFILSKWHKAEKVSRSLVNENPESYQVLVNTGDLMRMGHNIDVPSADINCQFLLNEAIRVKPNEYKAYFLLACLYSQAAPERVSEAIELFRKAEKLAAPLVIPDIYQGLGFVHMIKKDYQEAINLLEQYIQLAGNTADANAIKMVEHLKSGKTPTTHYTPPK